MGGDCRIGDRWSQEIVSIHAPAWGATRSRTSQINSSRFQSTPPHGGRLTVLNGPGRNGKVSIHAPAWGATGGTGFHLVTNAVSIHAPAWGATSEQYEQVLDFAVSIHAPAWGATIRQRLLSGGPAFQSTPPHGGRPDDAIINIAEQVVSIHAPAWGATVLTS